MRKEDFENLLRKYASVYFDTLKGLSIQIPDLPLVRNPSAAAIRRIALTLTCYSVTIFPDIGVAIEASDEKETLPVRVRTFRGAPEQYLEPWAPVSAPAMFIVGGIDNSIEGVTLRSSPNRRVFGFARDRKIERFQVIGVTLRGAKPSEKKYIRFFEFSAVLAPDFYTEEKAVRRATADVQKWFGRIV